MNVLVACEESQEVCKAFRARGHEAYSCDLQECSGGHPEWHIMGDALEIINGRCVFQTMDGETHEIVGTWDLLIAHPPCTYMSKAGARWMYPKAGTVNQERLALAMEAKAFFRAVPECGLSAHCGGESRAVEDRRSAYADAENTTVYVRSSILKNDVPVAARSVAIGGDGAD